MRFLKFLKPNSKGKQNAENKSQNNQISQIAKPAPDEIKPAQPLIPIPPAAAPIPEAKPIPPETKPITAVDLDTSHSDQEFDEILRKNNIKLLKSGTPEEQVNAMLKIGREVFQDAKKIMTKPIILKQEEKPKPEGVTKQIADQAVNPKDQTKENTKEMNKKIEKEVKKVVESTNKFIEISTILFEYNTMDLNKREQISKKMERYGGEAIEPLLKFMDNEDNLWQARASAIDTIKKIFSHGDIRQKITNELKGKVVSLFEKFKDDECLGVHARAAFHEIEYYKPPQYYQNKQNK